MRQKLIWFALIVVICGTITIGSAWIFFKKELAASINTDDLSVYGDVPAFSLIERSGRIVTRDSLKGQIWIADFIFTNCANTCPMMSKRMKEIQDSLENNPEVRMVSISVDPERDTPEKLAAYAEQYGAHQQRWLFLTGKESEIHDLATRGFLLGVDQGDAENPILHSEKFVLVDKRGRIRGYFESGNPEDKKRLLNAVRRVLQERG